MRSGTRDSPMAAPSRPPLMPTKGRGELSVEASSMVSSTGEPSSTRSQGDHFLTGFNVNNCKDARSIPDPPTPPTFRNRRRLSSPMLPMSHVLGSKGLEDVTNSGANSIHGQKRARKSLCHIPSPSVMELPESRDCEPHDSPRSSPKTLQVRMCLDDDSEKSEAVRTRKKRKKRQSMMLPRDLLQTPQASPTANRTSPPKRVSVPSPPKPFHGSLKEMNDLRSMVRRYCGLPKQERQASHFARSIEESTGYPLPSVLAERSPTSKSSQRRIILDKVAPVIAQMDQRKKMDVTYWEEATACHVHRGKSGKYRYYSLDRKQERVSTEEYQHRYLARLECHDAQRHAWTQVWKAKLTAPPPEFEPPRSPATPRKALCNKESDNVQQEPPKSPELASSQGDVSPVSPRDASPYDETRESHVEAVPPSFVQPILDEQHAPPKEEADTECMQTNDSMDICEQSVSLDLGDSIDGSLFPDVEGQRTEREASLTDDPEVVMKPESEKSQTTSDEIMVATDLPLDDCDGAHEVSPSSSEEQLDPEDDSPSTDVEMLPFPDRDNASLDPEVAVAEGKLWSRIDAALQDYSQEVLKILQGKRLGMALNNLQGGTEASN